MEFQYCEFFQFSKKNSGNKCWKEIVLAFFSLMFSILFQKKGWTFFCQHFFCQHFFQKCFFKIVFQKKTKLCDILSQSHKAHVAETVTQCHCQELCRNFGTGQAFWFRFSFSELSLYFALHVCLDLSINSHLRSKYKFLIPFLSFYQHLWDLLVQTYVQWVPELGPSLHLMLLERLWRSTSGSTSWSFQVWGRGVFKNLKTSLDMVQNR